MPETASATPPESSARSPPPIPEHQRTSETASVAQSVPALRPIFCYVRSRNQASLETFWTGCDRCQIKYEYEKVLLDRLLQCPDCLKPFLAVAVPAPPSRRASGGPTNFSPSIARTAQAGLDQLSVYHAESGLENVGTTPCTVPGGLHREKSGKRRGKECVKRASEAELSEPQIRVILMGRAKLDTLNQLNKWKRG